MAITLDGTPIAEYGVNSSPKTSTNTLTCSSSGNIVFVGILVNGATTTQVEDLAGNLFTKVEAYTTNICEIWARYYSGTFNDKIKVTWSGSPGFATFHAWALSGLNSATPDANAHAEKNGGSSPLSVSSNGSEGVIVAFSRQGSTDNPTAGTGYTQIRGNTGSGYACSQYKTFTGGALSAESVAIGTGNGDVNGFVAIVFTDVAGGSGTTINGIVGDAVANGTTAAVRRTVSTQTGNAAADGVTASIVRGIATATGNAVADGVTASIRKTIATSTGNAVADGSNAQITTGSGTTINTVTGNAVAAGANAGINISIVASVGNAVADGVLSALVRSIPAAVGNAVANGVAASISTNTIIAGLIGNAVANGVTASITNAEAGTLNATDLAAISALIDARCAALLNVWLNKMITDPVAGTWTIYADDDVTPLYSGPLYEDAAGTQPYRGRGAEHRGKNTI